MQKFWETGKGELKVRDKNKEVNVFDLLNYRCGQWMKELMSNHSTKKDSGNWAVRVLVELIICWKTSHLSEKYGFKTSSETGDEGLLGPDDSEQQAFNVVKSMVEDHKFFKSLLV